MKRVALGTLLLAAALAIVPSAMATSVTGSMAIAGLNDYTGSSIMFPASPPSLVFTSNGSLGTAMAVGTSVHLNDIDFATAAGHQLFDFNSGTVTMTIATWNVLQDTAQFLNIHGTATMAQTGFDASHYDFTLTSTRVSGITTYALDLAPVPEPSTLLTFGTGVIAFAGMMRRKLKRGR